MTPFTDLTDALAAIYRPHMADNSTKIDALDDVLDDAVTSETVDGESTSTDLSEARARRRELIGKDANLRKYRPRAARIRMGNNGGR